jgi:hypothetical protein
VIALLNSHFVPVYARNADYRDVAQGGAAPPEEKAEYHRIYREALQAKLSAGTVHVYILDPDGRPIDSLHVADAAKPDRLLEMMERTIKKLNVAAGKPLAKPAAQSSPPQAEKGALVLHLTARYLVRKGDDYVRVQPLLGTERSSQWGYLPSEDWLVLGQSEWTKLLPSGAVREGTSWEWDKEVSAKLLTHFYPPTENTDNRKNRIDQQVLKATAVSVANGVVRARIEGSLKMKHSFYHKDTSEFVEAALVGYLDFETAERTIRSLRLVTDRATYGGGNSVQPFGVAVRSLP